MKVSQRGLGTAKRAARSAVLAGIALVAAIATESHAQNVPYQSSLRDQFGTGPSRDPLPRGGFFLPRVEGAIQYAENLTLADDASPQVNSAGVELAPGFFTSYSGDSFLGAADYSLIGRAWDESDFDDISHRLAAGGRWTAAQDLFYVDGTAGYFDSIIDPAAGSNFGGIGLLGRDNLAETATATVSPTLRKRIREMEFQASYSYGRVWYLDLPDAATTPGVVATEEDSTDQTVRVSFGTAEPERLLTGRVFYDWDKSEFEVSLPYRYDRAGVEGGWRTSDFVTLVADAGLESALDENTTDGGLDDSFWHAGVRWEPDEQTVAEARYGQRFFGDSYYLNIEREARFLRIQASYSEEPTVESRRISTGDFNPGSLPSVEPGLELGRITADPFVAKVARIEATANGSRTEVSVAAYDSQRDYLSGPLADETTVGGNLLVTRQFAANLSGDFSASYEEYETGAEGIEPIVGADRTYLTEIFLRLNRAIGSKITTSLEGGYYNQGGEFAYDGWWVALRARYEPVR
jgi:hypothetical protein